MGIGRCSSIPQLAVGRICKAGTRRLCQQPLPGAFRAGHRQLEGAGRSYHLAPSAVAAKAGRGSAETARRADPGRAPQVICSGNRRRRHGTDAHILRHCSPDDGIRRAGRRSRPDSARYDLVRHSRGTTDVQPDHTCQHDLKPEAATNAVGPDYRLRPARVADARINPIPHGTGSPRRWFGSRLLDEYENPPGAGLSVSFSPVERVRAQRHNTGISLNVHRPAGRSVKIPSLVPNYRLRTTDIPVLGRSELPVLLSTSWPYTCEENFARASLQFAMVDQAKLRCRAWIKRGAAKWLDPVTLPINRTS